MPSRRSTPSSDTPSSDRGGDLDPDVGLCSVCRWARIHTTARASKFWRCLRADTDDAFPRYPRLPVLKCHGYEEPGETE